MPLLMKSNEAANPIDVGIFGAYAQVSHPDGIPHLI
jgi:hypothetical protein